MRPLKDNDKVQLTPRIVQQKFYLFIGCSWNMHACRQGRTTAGVPRLESAEPLISSYDQFRPVGNDLDSARVRPGIQGQKAGQLDASHGAILHIPLTRVKVWVRKNFDPVDAVPAHHRLPLLLPLC